MVTTLFMQCTNVAGLSLFTKRSLEIMINEKEKFQDFESFKTFVTRIQNFEYFISKTAF